MATNSLSYGVIGMGRWGTALSASLQRLDLTVLTYRRGDSQPLAEWVDRCDLICLAVRDDQIPALVSQLSQFELAGKTLLIHSGQTPLSCLSPLSQARIGKFHPLFSFSQPRAVAIPAGLHFAAEGPIAEFVEPWCEAWGATLHWLSGEQWARYHLAAVMASNFLPLLIRAGAELLQPLAQDPQAALEWLGPLVRNSLLNGLDASNPLPYSGPAIRGDLKTLESHRQLLAQIAPEWLPLYQEASNALASRRLKNS